jgi:ammonium transporter, Amt family
MTPPVMSALRTIPFSKLFLRLFALVCHAVRPPLFGMFVAFACLSCLSTSLGAMIAAPRHESQVPGQADLTLDESEGTSPVASPATSDLIGSEQWFYSVDLASKRAKTASVNSNNAWVLICSALVYFMIAPGLALFYSGLVRKKNVLSVFIQCLFLTSVMAVVWALFGYSLAFSNGHELNPWTGGLDYVFLKGVSSSWDQATQTVVTPMWISQASGSSCTRLSHMIFQGMFFSIAPVIMCGALAERVKFHGMVAFSILWGTFVYCPIAHWIWAGGVLSYPDGIFGGCLDFAGGTVVHVSAGVSALMAAIVLGPRLGFGKDPMPPHNLTYTAIGAAMLWFGWFGFNAGSAMSANEIASNAFVTTHLAAASGAVGWWLLEWRSRGKPTVLGVSSGLVAGLVCITPAAGYVQPMQAVLFGVVAGIGCYYACSLCKHWAGYDDALDAFGIHGVAGILGAILTGLFATRACNNVGNGRPIGLLEGGTLFQGQMAAMVVVILYSGLTSIVLLKMVDWTIGLRVSASDERQGLDVQQHGEEGYIFL